MNVLAFIPARGGSKGIPKKNLTPLCGKPLIQYTIEAAQQSKYISNIFLSSEDQEIIDFCKSLGLTVPYVRPNHLATDEADAMDAVIDAMKWLKRNSSLPDSIIFLQPTSPLRTQKDIDKAIELFHELSTESIMSVHEMIEHPYECLKLRNEDWVYLAKSPKKVCRRQDYSERFFYINGAIYLARTDFLLKEKDFVVEGKTSLYFMSPTNGIDIDDVEDLKRAEFYLQERI